MKLLDVFAILLLAWYWPPGVHTENVFDQFCSISHLIWKLGLTFCILVVFFWFAVSILHDIEVEPGRQVCRPCVPSILQQEATDHYFCNLCFHFSILHFIFYLQPIFPISFAAKVKIAFILQSLLLYNFNFAATDRDLCGHRARWFFSIQIPDVREI